MKITAAIVLYVGNDELTEYIRLLGDVDNPIYIAILVTIFILAFLFITLKYIIIPLNKRHAIQESELKLQNARIMALFADLNPDPLLRLDLSGNIIIINPEAKKCGFDKLMGKNISSIFPDINMDMEEFIKADKSARFYLYYMGRPFSVQLNGINKIGIAQMYFHDITELKKYQEALEKSEVELKEFSKYLQLKIEEERQRISSELHDHIGQNLLLLRLNLQRNFTELTGNANSDYYLECTDIIDGAVRDLKGISYALKPMVLQELGLVPALFSLVNKVKTESGLKGDIGFIEMEKRLNPNLETAIYRIVQEGLNNIVKYSKAKEFNIELVNNGKKIHIIISDDGVGFDVDEVKERGGMGLKNMRERTEAFNGVFRLNSSPKDGTIIIADFPAEIK